MDVMGDSYLKNQLQERRARLLESSVHIKENSGILRLLNEVDEALQRMEDGTYGICETCHDCVEKDRLLANPLVKYCLDHLTTQEQRALEQDMELASQIQGQFLPEQNVVHNGWEFSYYYKPAGMVSGDYCDLIKLNNENFYFVLGDVSGKGFSASMLMAHLHAIFRILIALNLTLPEIVSRANRLFSQTTMADSYATLICGRAGHDGKIELSNAGHCPPLVSQSGSITTIEATGLPIGIFPDSTFGTKSLRLQKGEGVVIYSDGFSEARNSSNLEYGTERLSSLLRTGFGLSANELIKVCATDLQDFQQGQPQTDDLSMLIIRRLE
ncbi:MAG: SpoIIE family protein phosphatase [Terriglobia bacterium]